MMDGWDEVARSVERTVERFAAAGLALALGAIGVGLLGARRLVRR